GEVGGGVAESYCHWVLLRSDCSSVCGTGVYRLIRQLSTRLVIFRAWPRSGPKWSLTWAGTDRVWPEGSSRSCENAQMSPGSRPPAAGGAAPGRSAGGSVTEASGVAVEHEGPVTVVSIDRPERRNAVDARC